jgi:hypothetical protein
MLFLFIDERVMKALLVALAILSPAVAEEPRKPDPKDTEVWSPEPRRVVPAPAGAPPSDAIVLFDGADLREWVTADAPERPPGWQVADGVLTVRGGSGDIQTRRLFTNYQLHIEWRVPAGLAGRGQARGNSGVFLASTGKGSGYEIQVLDCAGRATTSSGPRRASVPMAPCSRLPP